jgi:hypothetical protein
MGSAATTDHATYARTLTLFQRIALPRMQRGVAIGGLLGLGLALLTDQNVNQQLAIVLSATLAGWMLGFLSAILVPEGAVQKQLR